MKKFTLKELFLLPMLIFVSEIINTIILSVLGFLSENNTFRYVVLAIFSILMYYFMGKKIFIRLNDNKIKMYSLFITSVLIMLSYPFSGYLTKVTGEFFIMHILVCSPIANLMVMPFGLMPDEIAILLYALFSPINVVLIWLFSKIKILKKSDEIEDDNR